ncbi:uncharacterized protein LOC109613859 [Musca domestica]|uniref:Uncharacterized protein LOC109613859 n=1 Tax=Musca domestica TaxID=7370 RepID=A0ABM3VHU9_MUSDO|nr:uncharacterized protein LOC109613859 [Musca domestica]
MPLPKRNKQPIPQNSQDDKILQKLNDIYENVQEAFELNGSEISNLNHNVKMLQDLVSNQNEAISALRTEISKLKACSENQYLIITALLSEINVILKTHLTPGLEKQKYKELFPIRTQEELEAVENEINNENVGLMIATIKSILGSGKLQSNFRELIDMPLLLEYNVFGLQGLKRLPNYEKFTGAIYRKFS